MNEPMMFIVAMAGDNGDVFCTDLVAETYLDDLFASGYQWNNQDSLEYAE